MLPLRHTVGREERQLLSTEPRGRRHCHLPHFRGAAISHGYCRPKATNRSNLPACRAVVAAFSIRTGRRRTARRAEQCRCVCKMAQTLDSWGSRNPGVPLLPPPPPPFDIVHLPT